MPPVRAEAVFSEASDGDLRSDLSARETFSDRHGAARGWATVTQVHGSHVVHATSSGSQGEADAVWTTTPQLPVAVFTADCFGVVLTAPGAVGVAHGGWRGVDAGVVSALVESMTVGGHRPLMARIGPGIGPCCFEIGPEVASEFPTDSATTTWGTPSVDLVSAIRRQLAGVAVVVVGGCTRHDDRYFSHRRDGTTRRMATVGWLV